MDELIYPNGQIGLEGEYRVASLLEVAYGNLEDGLREAVSHKIKNESTGTNHYPDLIFKGHKHNYGVEIKTTLEYRPNRKYRNGITTIYKTASGIKINRNSWDDLTEFCKEYNLKRLIIVEIRLTEKGDKYVYWVIDGGSVDYLLHKSIAIDTVFVSTHDIYQNYHKLDSLIEFNIL
ncbi:hypothetical protein ES702_01445 [subsurface metagenome]